METKDHITALKPLFYYRRLLRMARSTLCTRGFLAARFDRLTAEGRYTRPKTDQWAAKRRISRRK